jgi:hypothetical protein
LQLLSKLKTTLNKNAYWMFWKGGTFKGKDKQIWLYYNEELPVKRHQQNSRKTSQRVEQDSCHMDNQQRISIKYI